jgi:hypothetical protein
VVNPLYKLSDKEKLNRWLSQNKVCQYELAESIGISRYTLIEWLRKPLSDERKERIAQGVAKIELQIERGYNHGK